MSGELELFDTAGATPVSAGRAVFVDFDGGQVAVVLAAGEPYPILALACRELGLDWKSQYAKLKADPAISMVENTTLLPGDVRTRTVMTTDLEGFVLWLAKINANKVSVDARDLVVTWQRKAARAIRERFFGKPTADPAAATPAPPVGLPTDYETALVHLLASVRERKALEARNAELEDAAEGYRHFLETDGTVKWANACEHLGVGPNLFGAFLRARKVLYTGGERQNRPYGDYRHWFAFPAYEAKDPESRERLARVPEYQRYDRRVTRAGMDGLLRFLKRHVVECGHCALCQSVAKSRPEVYAAWRPHTQIGA